MSDSKTLILRNELLKLLILLSPVNRHCVLDLNSQQLINNVRQGIDP